MTTDASAASPEVDRGRSRPRLPRWIAIALGFAALELGPTAIARAQERFSIEALRQRARGASKEKYVAFDATDLPEPLAKLDHDGYRRIVFRSQAALWNGEGLPFQLGFAHRGYLYRRRVPIRIVGEDGVVNEAMFDPAQFDYHLEPPLEVPPTLGYAGLAILQPKAPKGVNEIGSFLGASYFRILGQGHRYGASARGIAIDTASDKGEEFPEFVEMWVRRPAPDAAHLELYALLDSPSTTGAYQFTFTPGESARLDVKAWLYPRSKIGKLGLAPLTSMFFYGEERLRYFADFRPEVHDSDGVLVAGADGAWTWRPLVNPEREHRVSRLALDDPKGFGLLQRDRDFANYQDLQSRSELRPSYWVTPRGAWGKGALELVEIPTPAEHNDNIVLYWTPEQAPAPGQELAFEYTLTAFGDGAHLSPLGRVRATRVSASPSKVLFVLDFEDIETDSDAEKLVANVRSSAAQLENVVLRPNDAVGGVRLSFELVGAERKSVELHAHLKRGERPVTETWWFQWPAR